MKQYEIKKTQLEAYSDAYQNDKMSQMATLALSKTDLNDAIFSLDGANKMNHMFSIDIKTMPVTNQEKSGRCWLFAASNVVREKIAKELNLDRFEISQSFLAFWDKFERCNFFLENMIETAALPTDDRNVSFILKTGVHDGGQWTMFTNIVKKYGIVPKSVYAESAQSCNTRSVNSMINRYMKVCAIKLRNMIKDGADEAAVQAEKEAMLCKAYKFLCSCYTEPPKNFDFEYVDKDKNYHCEPGYTPKSFAEKYVGSLLDDAVSVITAPTADKPYGKTYTVRYLGNVVGGDIVCHLNITIDQMKEAIIKQLSAGKIVWFGSDCGKWGDRKRGIWDNDSFNAELLTGLDLEISKEDGLDYGFSAMNHAMCITGVNLVDGKPNRWKIENSWGEEAGVKGYYVCSDKWFDQFVYQAAIEKEYLGELAKLAEQEPKMLEAWDPMGTLAD